jgi:hypothetical protein
MTSEAQWIANRLNAQRSTGPRTTRGLKTSAQNAVKHGLSQPVSNLDPQVHVIEEILSQELSADLATRVAWQMIELERVERHLQTSMDQSPETQPTLVDGLTGIPLTPDILEGLSQHFSPSELNALLSRAITVEPEVSNQSKAISLRRAFRYLRKASNRLFKTIYQR